MKNKHQKSPERRLVRRPWLIVLILLLIAATALIIIKLLVNSTATSTEKSTTFSTEPVENSTNSTDSTKTPEQKPETPQKKEEKPQYDGENPNTSAVLTGSITTSRISGNNFIIRVSIDQYLSSGTCTLSMTGNGNTHTESVPVIADVSTSTCEGFDVPLKALGGGNYSINISLSSGGKTGTITGEVSL